MTRHTNARYIHRALQHESWLTWRNAGTALCCVLTGCIIIWILLGAPTP